MGGKVKQVWMPLSIFLVLTASIMWLTGNLHFGAPGVALDREEAGHGHDEAGPCDSDTDHEKHDKAAHGDDLDDAVDLDSLEKLECEHGVRTVDCDGCRFELGVVKLKTSTARALVSTGTLQEAARGETIRVTGQVKLDQRVPWKCRRPAAEWWSASTRPSGIAWLKATSSPSSVRASSAK